MHTSFVAPLSGVTGSAFAAVNPPVNVERNLGVCAESIPIVDPAKSHGVPDSRGENIVSYDTIAGGGQLNDWPCEADQASFGTPNPEPQRAIYAAVSPPGGFPPESDVEELLRRPRRRKPGGGVVTVANHVEWSPTKPSDIPPSAVRLRGMEKAADFAIAYNESAHAIRNSRWAVVTNRGTVLVLTGIRIEERPINPADFPPCVLACPTIGQAADCAADANAARLAMAIVPRQWSVSLRRADCISQQATKGGGA